MSSRASTRLPIFRKDIQMVVAWSERHFGIAAADRYVTLIRQSMQDLLEDPLRPGARTYPGLARNTYVYPLSFSRERVLGRTVKDPRHMILYRYAGETVEFARLLHDSRDLQRHLPDEYKGS